MNRRRRPYAVLLQLAFVATLLMALAPLVSRWQQAQGDPVMLMPGGMAHVMPAEAAADPAGSHQYPVAPHQGASHHDRAGTGMPHHGMSPHAMPAHAMAMHGTSLHEMSGEAAAASHPAPAAALDPHAGHGEACEYCMMASRLMPWLAVLILLLPVLQVIAPAVVRTVATPRSLRWPAHAARGPPLHA